MLAAIYLGKITKWNDEAIASINPALKLPSTAIASVHHANGSGTTFVFTDYPSMQNMDWKSRVGSSISVSWPGGAGAKGRDGVAGGVRQIKGGISYVESAYANQNKLTLPCSSTRLENTLLPPWKPSNVDWASVKNFAIDLYNEPGDASWPIESATFVLLSTDPRM